MSFLVSPGVHVKEIDLTNVVPSVDTTIGAIAGPFEKGPVSKVTVQSPLRLISSIILVNQIQIILNIGLLLLTF